MSEPMTPTVDPAYQGLFRRYLDVALRAALADLKGDTVTVDEGKRQQVWHLLSYGLGVAESWPHVRELLLALAPKMEQAGFRTEWLGYLETGLVQSRSLADRRAEAELTLQVGYLHLRLRQLDQAKAQLTAARDLFIELDDLVGQCAAINRLAAAVRYAGDMAQARSLLSYTLSVLPEESEEWGYSHFGAALLYRELLDLDTAAYHLEQCLAVSTRYGNRRQMGLCVLNMGLIFFEQKAYAQAVEHSLAAATIFEEIDGLQDLATAKMNAGIGYSQLGQVDTALTLYAQAELLFHRLHDPVSLAMIHCNQGIAYRQLTRPAEAIQAFQAGILLWDQVGNLKRRINLVSGLGKAQMDLGQFDQAIATLTAGLAELEAAGPDGPTDGQYARLVDVLNRDIALAQRKERSLD